MQSQYKKLDPKEVAERLGVIIKKLKLEDKLSVAWLKDFIYNFNLPDREINTGYFGKLLKLIPESASEKDFDEAMKIFNDAWNAFPQKIIGGISPQEKMEEGMKGEEKLFEDHFSFAKENLDEYMKWAFEEVLPRFEKYLKNSKIKKNSEIMGVAGIFLEICGQMGFFDFSRIHPGFFEDFPEMFTKTVIGPKIPKKDIKKYLENFMNFLEIYYGQKFLKELPPNFFV